MAEWIAIQSVFDEDIHIICSHCKEEFIGKSTLEEWKNEYLFCHRCGAKMKQDYSPKLKDVKPNERR